MSLFTVLPCLRKKCHRCIKILLKHREDDSAYPSEVVYCFETFSGLPSGCQRGSIDIFVIWYKLNSGVQLGMAIFFLYHHYDGSFKVNFQKLNQKLLRLLQLFIYEGLKE